MVVQYYSFVIDCKGMSASWLLFVSFLYVLIGV